MSSDWYLPQMCCVALTLYTVFSRITRAHVLVIRLALDWFCTCTDA